MNISVNTRRLTLLVVSIVLLAIAFIEENPLNVISAMSSIPAEYIVCVIGLFILNLIVVSWRLVLLLSHFGITLPVGIVIRASVAGHYAGLFVFSIVGQVVGRDYVLRHHGVTPVLSAALVFYEKMASLFVGGLLCLIGAVYLADKLPLIEYLPNIPYAQMVFIAVVGFALSCVLWRSKFESLLFSRLASMRTLFNFIVIVITTVIANLIVISSFVVGVLAFYPDANLLEIFAAAAIISFAASLPLTLNGWGLREMAALYILGMFGIAASKAVALSVLVGLCASVVILIATILVFYGKQSVEAACITDNYTKNNVDVNKIAVWVVTTFAAILIFFQLHVVFPGGVINLNLADPFAIIAFAVVAAHWVFDRNLPHWRFDKMNALILVFSLLLMFGFFRGVLDIGVTQWALAGRVIGWLVVVGYMAAGYLVVSYMGARGFRRMTEMMVSVAVVIVLFSIVQYFLVSLGMVSRLGFEINFSGFAGNRIAFAFQMVVCSALMLVYSSLRNVPDFKTAEANKIIPFLLFTLMHGVILNGLFFTASRAGLIAESLLMASVYILRLADRRFVISTIGVAGVFWFLIQLIPGLQAQGSFSGEESIVQHWDSIMRGIEVWLTSPIFGAGLGVFVERSVAWFGNPLVIHSVPVWFLAEFGILGAGTVLLMFILLVKFLLKSGLTSLGIRLVALLLLVFVTFGLVHDVFYQRIFWLLLGGGLAVGGIELHRSTQRRTL
jgi:hypothetical protein